MKVLIMINSDMGLYKFRRELLLALISLKHEVYIMLPNGPYVDKFIQDGCRYIEVDVDRRGIDPVKDLKTFMRYLSVLNEIKPDIVLTYTIKPNLYGALACRLRGIRNINTVTGLGSVYIQDLWIKRVVIWVNRFAFAKSERTFFLNEDNKEFYLNAKIIRRDSSVTVVHGSGVNIKEFAYNTLPDKADTFTFIARLIKDKGILEFIDAARILKNENREIIFNIVGPVDDQKLLPMVNQAVAEGFIVYHGQVDDVQSIIQSSTCIVLPSYGEGCGTVLLEGAAIGRPLITCDTYGCKDNVVDGYNGYLCKVGDVKSLYVSMKRFASLRYEEKAMLSKNSRILAVREFDRQKIVDTYIEAIEGALS